MFLSIYTWPVFSRGQESPIWIHCESITYQIVWICQVNENVCYHWGNMAPVMKRVHFSLLESWIWLQRCGDIWEFCWWWSGLFQFTEVISVICLMITPEDIHWMKNRRLISAPTMNSQKGFAWGTQILSSHETQLFDKDKFFTAALSSGLLEPDLSSLFCKAYFTGGAAVDGNGCIWL